MAVADVDVEFIERLKQQAGSISLSDKDLDEKLKKVSVGMKVLESKGLDLREFQVFTVVKSIINMRKSRMRIMEVFK